jgi:hypothetical protein
MKRVDAEKSYLEMFAVDGFGVILFGGFVGLPRLADIFLALINA